MTASQRESEQQKWAVACHEAGHAVMAWQLGVKMDGLFMRRRKAPDGWQEWDGAAQIPRDALSREHSLLIGMAASIAGREVAGAIWDPETIQGEYLHLQPTPTEAEIAEAKRQVKESLDIGLVRVLASRIMGLKVFEEEASDISGESIAYLLRKAADESA